MCSSGGTVTALLSHALESGVITAALVTRMRRDKPWLPETFIAGSPEEVFSARGSKYCPVPVNSLLKEIIRKEGRFAVVGLPCHIYGMRMAQKVSIHLREKVVLSFGLFCAGGRSFRGTEAFLLQAGLHLSDVESLAYRGSGWPGKIEVNASGGRAVICDYEAGYPFMCMNDIHRCSLCPDKSSELADISFGDLWLAEERHAIGSGKSVCIARSKAGEDLMEDAARNGKVEMASLHHDDVVRAVAPLDKKRRVGARLAVQKCFRKPVPDISGCGLQPYSFSDVVKGIQYYVLQQLCKFDVLRAMYFKLRPKYHRLKKRIEYVQESSQA
jgi:coenzyme F420 hydrogenase subunit beta